MKKKVLFICTHNSARSQMAEAFIKSLFPEKYDAYSAGTEPGNLNQYAVEAMKEIGIDISGSRIKSVKEFLNQTFDYVVTVCDKAKESCPFFPGGVTYIHKNFEDPSGFTGSHDEIMQKIRSVRDDIMNWIIENFSNNPSIQENFSL
jgi:arsenate reductase